MARPDLVWEDTPDEWTDAIKEAHPARSESHDEYAVAMQMVGHRHSKGELVSLVNWLLVRLRDAGGLAVAVDELTAQRDASGQKAHYLQVRLKILEVVVELARRVDELFSRDAPMMLIDLSDVAEAKLEALRVALDLLQQSR